MMDALGCVLVSAAVDGLGALGNFRRLADEAGVSTSSKTACPRGRQTIHTPHHGLVFLSYTPEMPKLQRNQMPSICFFLAVNSSSVRMPASNSSLNFITCSISDMVSRFS